jgi:hypothetical protein
MIIQFLRLLPILCTLTACAVGAAPLPQYGILRGQVVVEEGIPYPGARVQVRSGTRQWSTVATAEGRFLGVVAAGEVTVQVGETLARATAQAGEVTTLVLVAKLAGVALHVLGAGGGHTDVDLRAVYRTPGEGAQAALPVRFAPGRYWFADVPPEATAFTVVGYQESRTVRVPVRQHWDFPARATSRVLTLTLRPTMPVILLLVDRLGKPMVHTSVRGSLWYTTPDLDPRTLDEEPGPPGAVRVPLRDLRTDEVGQLDLGPLVVQPYELMLASGRARGDRKSYQVRADGTLSAASYALTLPVRATVTHRVLGSEGQPRPGAQVTMTYCWFGRVTTRQAQADATGTIEWKDLPPVRAIVWGEAIQPGVLAADATEITKPLPRPYPEGPYPFRFHVMNPGDALGRYIWIFVKPTAARRETERRPDRLGVVPDVALILSCQSGAPLHMLVEAKMKPPRSAGLQNMILPYLDVDATADVPLTLEEDITLDDPLAEGPDHEEP